MADWIRNEEEYREVLARLREIFEERERQTEFRRLLGYDEERGISISAVADDGAEKPRPSQEKARTGHPASSDEEPPPKKKARRRNVGRGIPKRNTKQEGELSEFAAAWMAGKRGIRSAKPHGDSLPFDLIGITGEEYELSKLQVRCTAHHKNFIYAVSLMKSAGTKRYEPHDFDFLVAYIVPEERWYVIPYADLPPTNEVYLHPRAQSDAERNVWDAYQDRWDLIGNFRR